MSSSPAKFVKPADLFKMRRRPHVEPQSPMKCLNNLADPSPTKNLPVLLKNPFGRPVKRKLNLGFSPKKSPTKKSPHKRSRMIELDEDANMEAPRMRQTLSPQSRNKLGRIINGPCYLNNWTLRTKLKINFQAQCKNWEQNSVSTHKRHNGTNEDSPSKVNDKTISIEAIKNVATVYQHPYLSWLPLYPRTTTQDTRKIDPAFKLTKDSPAVLMIHKDWCESLNDLVNLLIAGRCPFFYVCTDNYNILFKFLPPSNTSPSLIQAFISPLSYGLGCELNKMEVEFKCLEVNRASPSISITNSFTKDNSQASFGSSQTRTTMTIDDENSQVSRQPQSTSKVTPSIDSGNASDLEDDFGLDENDEDATQILEGLGISEQELSIKTKRKGFSEADSNTQQSKQSSSYKPLAAIEGVENIRKLVKFLQSNRLYTINYVGKFACIPPTLLAPCEFRLSTPQYPEVILSKNMIETTAPAPPVVGASPAPASKLNTNKSPPQTPSNNNGNELGNPVQVSPTYVELKGTILPNLYKKLHKLLTVSDNMDHTCTSTTLESCAPFGAIQFSSY